MPHVSFLLPAIIACGLLLGWSLAHWLERRSHRACSVSLLDELEMAYTPRRSIELRCRPDRLARALACLAENIDRGFGPRHARRLHARITGHPGHAMHHAFFPVKVSGQRTQLDLQWSRDPDGRIRLLVLAVPPIIRALKQQQKAPPQAAPAPPPRACPPAVETPPLRTPAGG